MAPVQNPAMQETTADRVGLVFRTKVELYYFLSTTCKHINSLMQHLVPRIHGASGTVLPQS